MSVLLGIAVGALASLIAIAGYIAYRARTGAGAGSTTGDAPALTPRSVASMLTHRNPQRMPAPLGTDLRVLDESGQVIVRTQEIAGFPAGVTQIGADPVAIRRGRQLAADLFKGVASLPGKTVEVVFDPKILQGLQNGTLEVMPASKGGAYAIARNVETGRTAGHGRLIESGGARQLAAGLFHVASIAVAQSHLADINRSLEHIKGLTRDVKRYLTDKDLSELEGGLQYLQELAAMLGRMDDPAQIPAEKRHQLETLRRKSLEWMALVRRHGKALDAKIGAQKSEDWFGTGHTNAALSELASEAADLVAMCQLVLQLSATIEACDTCIAPARMFNPGSTLTANGEELLAVYSKALNGFRDRTHNLLGQALCNKDATLQARREVLIGQQETLLSGVQQCHAGFDGLLKALEQRSHRVQASNEGARVLLSFDQRGEIDAVAIP